MTVLVARHLTRTPAPADAPLASRGTPTFAPAPVCRTEWLAHERVRLGAERVLHLLGRHLIVDLQAVDTGESSADPSAGRLALQRVIVGQWHPSSSSRAQRLCRIRYSYPTPAES